MTPMSIDPRELDARGNNDGRFPCSECGDRIMFAIPRGDRPTCGDCIEGRTPLKREIVRLRTALASVGMMVSTGNGVLTKGIRRRVAEALGGNGGDVMLVAIESPYAGDVEANVAYLKRCILDSLSRGESPYASHLFFTQPGLLDDRLPIERMAGINAGFAWASKADIVAVSVDRGLSRGVNEGISRALAANQPIEFRSLDGADLADYPPLNCTVTP